jgi:hypothetical protein
MFDKTCRDYAKNTKQLVLKKARSLDSFMQRPIPNTAGVKFKPYDLIEYFAPPPHRVDRAKPILDLYKIACSNAADRVLDYAMPLPKKEISINHAGTGAEPTEHLETSDVHETDQPREAQAEPGKPSAWQAVCNASHQLNDVLQRPLTDKTTITRYDVAKLMAGSIPMGKISDPQTAVNIVEPLIEKAVDWAFSKF